MIIHAMATTNSIIQTWQGFSPPPQSLGFTLGTCINWDTFWITVFNTIQLRREVLSVEFQFNKEKQSSCYSPEN